APLRPLPRTRRAGGPDDLPAGGGRGRARRRRRGGRDRAGPAVSRALVLALALAALGAAPAGAYQHLSQHAAVSGVQPDHWQTLPIDLSVDGGPTDVSAEIATAIGAWNAVPTARNPWGTA